MNFRLLKLKYFIVTVVSVGVLVSIYFHRPFRTRMSAYVTDLSGRTFAQRENIKHAGLAVSGVVMKSGETFSLNNQAGPYTRERGFLSERSFLEGETISTPGGGVCQVASTLYNAARLAGLEVLERIPHTRAVASVPPGMDATLVYGVADLKFQNNFTYPIKITSRILRDQLLIEIWGKEPPHGVSEL